ncbi:MAG: FAD-dependent oxidoreductase [Actinobacteria bacterium]|nr:FAD-dependent oxidoreductase [Actinomycetota bacterium]MBU1943542.1 FAD-dependent oxidoreductase [Actinomycetota bacterium]MBU2687551.1 FAD-dependent oxidoreductase [Actinomycetota bacterium]
MKALVMGGGMSGLATAINLLDLGVEVELIEADEMFGGRASSWLDEDGDMIDNALHVFFPYYKNLMRFFEKMGIADNIAWKHTEFYYAMPGGRKASLRFKDIPAPFHAAYAFAHLLKDYKDIPRWKIIVAGMPMTSGLFMNIEQLDRLDSISMATFVNKYGSLDGLKLMEPGINGLTFTPSWGVSAKVMLNWGVKVFSSAKNARVGFANGGLGEIWVDNCLDYIRGKGGTVALNQAVTAINLEGGQVTSVVVNDSEVKEADIYISAISPYSLRRVLPDEAFDMEYFRDLWHFQHAPSMSLQVWFDRKLTDIDVTFFSTDCIFNTYADLSNVLPHIFKGGSMFEMVLSPADHIQGLPDRVIFDIAIEQIRDIFPEAREAEVRKWKVVRERQGVYRASPGMESHRPFQRSPVDNLYLTGDYTKTHVSSGGMEAAIWNANKTAELIAADRLDESISLNVEFEIDEPFMKYIRQITAGAIAVGGIGALALMRKMRKR